MIGFKNGKDKALADIECVAHTAAQQMSYVLTGHPINSALSQMIAAAVVAGIEEMLKQQYTYDDLDTDLGLKS